MKKMKLAVCIALWTIIIGIGALTLWIRAPGPSVTKCCPTADTSLHGTLRDLGAGLTGIVTPSNKHGK